MSGHLKGRQFQAAVGSVAFVAGVMLLPAAIAAALSVGLGCHDLDRQACFQMLGQAQLQAEAAELGGDNQLMASLGQPQR